MKLFYVYLGATMLQQVHLEPQVLTRPRELLPIDHVEITHHIRVMSSAASHHIFLRSASEESRQKKS